MASGEVSHKGKVVSVGKDTVSVQIVSESACSACHAAGLCGASESKKKIVDVPVYGDQAYSIGQEVEVCLARKMGTQGCLAFLCDSFGDITDFSVIFVIYWLR